MSPQALRCAIYCRQSRTVTDESASLAQQQADLEALAQRKGWVIAGIYVDANAPADALDRRSRWLDLLDDAGAGNFEVVAAFDTSRLWRSVELKLATFKQLHTAGVPTVATLAGESSTDPHADPESGLISTILAAVAEFDNRMRGLKVRRARQRAAEAGHPHPTGRRPWGYTDTHRTGIVTLEAEAIRTAARRVLEGEPLHVVAAALNAAGQTTSTGRTWTGSLLRQALLSPGLAGLRGHNRDRRGRYSELYQGAWEPVLDRTTWEALRERFQTTTRAPYRKMLLSGLATCGRPRDDRPPQVCGGNLTATRDRRGVRCYRCVPRPEFSPQRCGRLVVVAEPLEDEVRDQVLSALDPGLIARHLAAASGSDGDAADATSTLLNLAARREAIGAELADGLDVTVARMALRRLDELEADARARLRHSQRGDDELLREAAVDPAKWWEANPQRRRVLLDAVVHEIQVLPATRGGRTFDPERVRVLWRA